MTVESRSLPEQAEYRACAVLGHFDAYRTFTHLLGSPSHGGEPALAARARAELHAMVTSAEPMLKHLMRQGMIRSGDSELLAYMLWGALIGAGERFVLDGKYSLERVLEGYLAFVASGTGASAAVASAGSGAS